MNQEQEKLYNDIDALLEMFDNSQCVKSSKEYNIELTKQTLIQMIDHIIYDKTEGQALKDWMTNHEFFKTPASTRFHGNFEGGLLIHTMMVIVQSLRYAKVLYENYKSTPKSKQFDFTCEDIFIAALAHDFCKSGSYRIEYHNTKDILGNWVKKPTYHTKSELRNLGHGNESVLLLLESMPSLIKKRHVIEAISRHMGFSDLSPMETYNYSNFLQNPLVVLIQIADETAAAWFDC